MLKRIAIRNEYQKVLTELASLVRDAESKGAVAPPSNTHAWVLYSRLAIVKDMLEWFDSSLLKPDPRRVWIEQLMADSKYYAMGPVETELMKRRWD